jgi:hypothetical protein
MNQIPRHVIFFISNATEECRKEIPLKGQCSCGDGSTEKVPFYLGTIRSVKKIREKDHKQKQFISGLGTAGQG